MTLGNKIKNIRVRLCLSQEDLSNILNVSRQVVSKWETDNEIPDISNLQELSKVLDISIDNLLNNDELLKLKMKIELDKNKYKNVLTSYKKILDEYFKDHDIYVLSVYSDMNLIERILNLFTGGDYYLIKDVSDLSPYYLITKNETKLLINIKDHILNIYELQEDINTKRFKFDNKTYVNCGKLKK